MSLARIAHTKKKSLHTFHEHPFLINCKNLCRFWHGHSSSDQRANVHIFIKEYLDRYNNRAETMRNLKKYELALHTY